MKSINLMKNIGRFTPPPKLPSPIYPQIVCTIYPQIVCMIYPPPEIANSDLPSNCLYDLVPPKSASTIYPQII